MASHESGAGVAHKMWTRLDCTMHGHGQPRDCDCESGTRAITETGKGAQAARLVGRQIDSIDTRTMRAEQQTSTIPTFLFANCRAAAENPLESIRLCRIWNSVRACAACSSTLDRSDRLDDRSGHLLCALETHRDDCDDDDLSTMVQHARTWDRVAHNGSTAGAVSECKCDKHAKKDGPRSVRANCTRARWHTHPLRACASGSRLRRGAIA